MTFPALDMPPPVIIKQEKTSREVLFIISGGDWLSLFEPQPLEDVLAGIAVGWNDTRRCAGRLKVGVFQEVGYVL